MSERRWALVCYDIRDARRLRQVAKLLEGYGERIQYSVFRCRLTAKDEERLRWELTQQTTEEDSWLIIPLCATCGDRVRRQDTRATWAPDPPPYMVL